MKKQSFSFDRDYLRLCKESSPEQKLDWLAAAVEFAQEAKKNAPFRSRTAKK